jgi:hypothetical protein
LVFEQHKWLIAHDLMVPDRETPVIAENPADAVLVALVAFPGAVADQF